LFGEKWIDYYSIFEHGLFDENILFFLEQEFKFLNSGGRTARAGFFL